VKNVGKPCEGEPHARIDGGGAGNGCAVARVTGSGRPRETSGMGAGAYRSDPLPRQLPTRLRPGVSSATFHYLSHYTWRQVMGWLRRKHRRTSWKTLRRRYSDSRYSGGRWWPASADRELFNPATVRTTRYRYRGRAIPSPWPVTG
jgi:hypothetical protein